MAEDGVVPGYRATDVVRRVVDVGGRSVTLLAPRSHEVLSARGDPFTSAIPRLPLWAEPWPAGLALAELVLAGEAGHLRHRRVIELGAGLGLAGIAAGLAGARVTLTDRSPEALAFALASARANGLEDARAEPLIWSRDPARPVEPYEIALGADLLADPRALEPLLATLAAVLAPGGEAYLADPIRVGRDRFLRAAAAAGFAVDDLEDAPRPTALVEPSGLRGLAVHRMRLRHGAGGGGGDRRAPMPLPRSAE